MGATDQFSSRQDFVFGDIYARAFSFFFSRKLAAIVVIFPLEYLSTGRYLSGMPITRKELGARYKKQGANFSYSASCVGTSCPALNSVLYPSKYEPIQ